MIALALKTTWRIKTDSELKELWDESENPEDSYQAVSDLEERLNTRFNFYLVFLYLFTVAVFSTGISLWQKTAALLLGTIISYFIQRSVQRTHELVEIALDEIARDPEHAYSVIRTRLPREKRRLRANQFLIRVPHFMMALFFVLFIFSLINFIYELGAQRPAWLSYLQKWLFS